MKKSIIPYWIIWACALVLFNLIVFVVPVSPDAVRYTTTFWIGYSLITVTFIGQLACYCYAVMPEDNRKLFYRIPLIRASYVRLVISFVAGSVFLLFPHGLPWVGVIVCAIVLFSNVLSLAKAIAASSAVERVDERVDTGTRFIRMLTVDADALTSSAKSDAVKAECRRVYEAIRYSDPMSNDALADVEREIGEKVASFTEAVKIDDVDAVKEISAELLALIDKRNKKCKVLK